MGNDDATSADDDINDNYTDDDDGNYVFFSISNFVTNKQTNRKNVSFVSLCNFATNLNH